MTPEVEWWYKWMEAKKWRRYGEDMVMKMPITVEEVADWILERCDDIALYLIHKPRNIYEAWFWSFVKWEVVVRLEEVGREREAGDIGASVATCGLCMFFMKRCKKCVIHDGGYYCFKEWDMWADTNTSAWTVLRELRRRYDEWKIGKR